MAQLLADQRAEICVKCAMNEPGNWYTVAPAEIIKETLEARKDLKLETPSDGKLQSCKVCRCLLRLKVWCPLPHIVEHTPVPVLREFPNHCWIIQEQPKRN